MRPWSAQHPRRATAREPSAHDAGPRARRRASPPPQRLARGSRGQPSPGRSAPPARGPSRGTVAPRSTGPRRRRALARARPRRGTGLEPDGVAGRKQATARRPTQPAAVAHRWGVQRRRSLMIFACNQALSTVLELQHDISATASGAGHGVRRRAPWTRRSLEICSSTGGPPHLYLRPALVTRGAGRHHELSHLRHGFAVDARRGTGSIGVSVCTGAASASSEA